MPVGPYEDFDSCVAGVMKKEGYDKETAHKVCGKMEQASNSQINESNGKLYVKAFLLDSSTNVNGWGVTKQSIDDHISSFIGKPLVLTEDFDHPDIDDGNINHVFANQEPFRVGTIVDITQKDGVYYAISEVTDQHVKEAVTGAKLPPFVSPAIYPIGGPQPEDAIANWTGVHLAIVDDPAFGARKAQVTSTCSGEKAQCLMQLRKASIEKNGVGSCGFCRAAKMKAYYAKLVTNPDNTSLNSSHVHESENKGTVEAPQTTTVNPVDTSKFVPIEEFNKLKAENDILKQANSELKKASEETASRVAALEQASRRSKIASIVTAEVIKDEKKREETINTLAALNLKDEDFSKAIQPLLETAKLKVASRFAYDAPEVAAPETKPVAFIPGVDE